MRLGRRASLSECTSLENSVDCVFKRALCAFWVILNFSPGCKVAFVIC